MENGWLYVLSWAEYLLIWTGTDRAGAVYHGASSEDILGLRDWLGCGRTRHEETVHCEAGEAPLLVRLPRLVGSCEDSAASHCLALHRRRRGRLIMSPAPPRGR